MSDNGSSKVAFFLAGMGIGAILALLFAPKSGKETREVLAQKVDEGKDFVAAKTREVRRQSEEMWGKGKEALAKQKEQLSAALEAGKQAYQEDKAKSRS